MRRSLRPAITATGGAIGDGLPVACSAHTSIGIDPHGVQAKYGRLWQVIYSSMLYSIMLILPSILGGLDLIVSSLLHLLVPALPAEPLVSHLRVVDKFSINPPTTYISNATLTKFRERQDVIEYRQSNLKNPGKYSSSNALLYHLNYFN